jgi:subtilisin-like proprotein convertase family protein
MKMRPITLALATVALATVSFASNAADLTFSNTTSISIPDVGLGNPYPSTINVSGVTGTTTNVTVTLNNYSHTFSNDVEILLVAPTGQKIILNNDVGGSSDYINATITYSASASGGVSGSPIPSGTYLPAASDPNQSLPGPAPAAPYSTDLTTLNGVSPNGTWSLYVNDDLAGDSGTIANGWSLTISGINDQTCASEGYTGTKLTWCQNICEKGYTGATLDMWIHRWVNRYRDLPYCAREGNEEPPPQEG